MIEELDVEIVPGPEREAEVRVGEQRWTVERDTDLGGITLVGVARHRSVVLVVDEVDTSGQAFELFGECSGMTQPVPWYRRVFSTQVSKALRS